MLDLIKKRKQQILVHSFLYYQLGENIISDYTFDKWSKELADLLVQYPEEYKEGFEGFEGSTGVDLPYNTPKIQSLGYVMLKLHKQKTTV